MVDFATAQILRCNLAALMDELYAKSQDYGIAPPNFGRFRPRLEEPGYRVLVCGEAKRGKSTFVNALLGRDLVPTDVAVATSQVFLLNRAETEHYVVRFDDGSTREIEPAELRRYGCQVHIDSVDRDSVDRDSVDRDRGEEHIRWIEAAVPAPFLPEGVALLDTPGLGSLYSAHSQITQRFVPDADGVVFVLDAERPVQQMEIDFIEKLLESTRNIFFILTKIDLFEESHWQTIRMRNEEILLEKLGGRLPDVTVWPVSSTNLLAATRCADAFEAGLYEEISLYKPLLDALQRFLVRVTAWSRVVPAALAARNHHGTAREVLTSRLGALASASRQRKEDRLRDIAGRRRAFEADWGANGRLMADTMEQIRRANGLARQHIHQFLSPSGALARRFRVRIAELEKVGEATKLSEELGEEVVRAALSEWDRARISASERCAEILRRSDLELAAPVMPDDAAGPDVAPPPVELEGADNLYDRLRSGLNGAMMLPGAIFLGSVVVSIAPIAAPLAFGAIVLAAAAPWKSFQGTARQQLQTAKSMLSGHLSDVAEQIRQHFFNVDLETNTAGRVPEYFNAVEAELRARVEESAAARLELLRMEQEKAVEITRLDEEQCRVAAAELRDALAAWDGLGIRLNLLVRQVDGIDHEPKTGTNRAATPALRKAS